MKRILLTIAYDGTDFCGFQLQPALRTVEGELNAAITHLTGTLTAVIGASRTDSGVHALGNAAVFDTESAIPPERFAMAVNTMLPSDVRVISSREVPVDWHPRHQNCEKTYAYRVDCGYVPCPLMSRYAMHFPRNLDVTRMQEAAERLLGEHDFTSFSNPKSQVLMAGGSPVRTLTAIRVSEESVVPGAGFDRDAMTEAKAVAENAEPAENAAASSDTVGNATVKDACKNSSRDFGRIVTIEVTGNGFLYNMVRIIAGTLLDVGTGRFTPDDVSAMLAACDRTKAGLTAQARGLCLQEIIWKQ